MGNPGKRIFAVTLTGRDYSARFTLQEPEMFAAIVGLSAPDMIKQRFLAK
jgi:hypothetical protein